MEKIAVLIGMRIVCFCIFILQNIVINGQELQKCPAYPDTIGIMQPSEKFILKCFIKGDEYSSILTTIDGYPLMENIKGEIEYAIIESTGDIKSSGILAKNKENRTENDMEFLKTVNKELIRIIKKTPYKKSDLILALKSFPPTGTRNLLVLLIDFTDHTFQITNNSFNNLMNQIDFNGTGSFRDYWLESSYINLTVNSTIDGWHHATNNMAFYGSNSGGNDNNPRLLVQEAIDAAENAGIDFSIFDNDNDGNVDGIIVIHAGYGEEAGGGANTIWSHHWTLGSYKRTYDGVTIDDYAICPELRGNTGNNIINIGVICHEFGHSLGLPDLYDTDISNGNSEGIGNWGLMGSGNWNNNGASPSNLCIWSKDYLNWSNPIVISSGNSISLPNSTQNNISYRINTPHANEYFLLENRQQIGFDVGLSGTGLAVWHINTSKTSSSHIDNNDVNADENLKGVDLEEADGDLDLDNNANRGDNGDLFPGNSCNSSFDDNTTPNSQTYSPIVNTNRPIINIIESGNNIRFEYMGFIPISGPSIVCTSNTTFTLTGETSGLTIDWDCNTSVLTQVGGDNGSSYIVKSKYLSTSGEGWVRVNIITDCGDTITRQRTVWAGKPNPNNIEFFSDPWGLEHELSTCETVSGEAEHPYESMISAYQWDIPNASDWEITEEYSGGSSDYKYVEIDYWEDPAPSQELVRVRATNSCGTSSWKSIYWDVDDCGGGWYMSFTPNPANNETTLELKTENIAKYTEGDEWEMEIYSQQQVLIKKATKLKDNKHIINTTGWKEGIYFVRVKINNNVYSGKFIVAR